MRRVAALLFCFTLLLLSSVALADSDGSPGYAPQRRVTGGITIGASFAGLGGQADLDLMGTPLTPSPAAIERLSGGGHVTLALDERWGATVELLYATRGASASQVLGGFGDASGAYALDYDLRYLQLPLLATYTFPYDRRFVQYVFAGPDLGFLLSSKIEGEGVVIDPDDPSAVQEFAGTEDIADDTARFDFGLTIGAGVKLPLPSGRLLLAVRYTVSLNKAIDENTITVYQGVTLTSRNLRHRALSLTVGYEL